MIIHLFSIPKLNVIHDQLQLVKPLIRFQRFWADWSNLNTIDNVVSRLPQDRLRLSSACGEGGLNGIRGPQVNPVRCREIVKGQQFIPVFFEVFHGLRVLVPESP